MNKNNKIIPKKDIVFKRLFGSVGSENILRALLEAILEIKIESVQLNLNKELTRKNIKGKRNILDVLAKLDDGTLVNVEMQMSVPRELQKRALDYWADLYTNQLESGKDYSNLKQTIAIWILDEDFFDELPEYHNKFVIKENKTGNNTYFKDFELHFFELNKLRNSDILKPRKLDFWMWFIDYTNKELVEMAYRSEDEIREAVDKLRELSSDKEIARIMFLEDIYEMDQKSLMREREEKATARGLEKGLKRGIKEGMKEAKKETAKKLKKMGLTNEQIAEATELPLEEIEKIN